MIVSQVGYMKRRAAEPQSHLWTLPARHSDGAPACGLYVACFASTGPCLMILPGKIGAYRKDEGEAGPTLARRLASSMSSGPGAASPAPRLARLTGAQSVLWRTRSAKPGCGRLR